VPHTMLTERALEVELVARAQWVTVTPCLRACPSAGGKEGQREHGTAPSATLAFQWSNSPKGRGVVGRPIPDDAPGGRRHPRSTGPRERTARGDAVSSSFDDLAIWLPNANLNRADWVVGCATGRGHRDRGLSSSAAGSCAKPMWGLALRSA